MSHPRDEVEAAVTRLIGLRDRISEGEGRWSDLAPLFTDDVVYVDPAWGRIEGIEAVRAEVLGEAMEGLDWRFPTDHYLIDGDTVMVKWRQVIPGRRRHRSRAVGLLAVDLRRRREVPLQRGHAEHDPRDGSVGRKPMASPRGHDSADASRVTQP
jgi:hypothetical protein